MTRAAITTHILDLDSGTPAEGVEVNLIHPEGHTIATANTNNNGRIEQWSQHFLLVPGTWQLTFLIEPWFEAKQKDSFFSNITLAFKAREGQAHYHVPLLLNAYGYSTYRGS